jgi:hypothetical protein
MQRSSFCSESPCTPEQELLRSSGKPHPWDLAQLQVRCLISGSDDDKVRDPQGARNMNEILHDVAAADLEVYSCVRLHHCSHIST